MAESSKRSHLPRNLLIGFVVLFVLYACAGFLILPWWLEKTLPEQMDQRMGWKAEVTDIRFNPFLLTLDTEGLSAEDSGGEKVLGFDQLHVDLNVFQLVRGIVGFEAIRLQEPYIRLDLLEGYGVNFARDWQENNPETAESDQDPVAAEESSGPPKLYFGQVAIDGGELLFRDYSQSEPAEFHITPLDLTLNDLATWPRDDRDSDYYFMAAIGNQTVEWEGDLSVTPLYSKGHLKVAGVGYETLKHFIAPYLPYDLRGGKVTLSSDYELQVADGVFLSTANGNLELDELALAISEGSDATSLTTGTLAIDKIGFDLTGMDASVGQISLGDLDVTLVRDEEGQIDWLKPLSNTGGDETPEAPEAESSSGPGLTWSVAGIELSGARVHWLDRQPATDADLALEQVELKVGPVTHDLEEPVTYSVSASLASGGRLSVNGQATPAPFTLEAAISGSDIALAAVEPYVQEGANLNIAGGSLGVDGNLDLDAQTTPLTGTFSGTAQIEGFAIGLPGDEDRLLSWQTLQLAPVEYNVNPARLEIGTVTLKQLAANVVRGPDAIHNVERIARTAEAGSSAASNAETSSGDESGFIFRIGQVLLEDGAIGYTDRTLSPAFTTSLDELNGSVTGLSNIPPQQGKVAIKGRVDSVANLDFQGTIGTLGTEELSDLKLSMNDLSLPVLSPYFGRYLGYGVDSGKLDLDLDYKIAGTRIDAENIVIMDQLALGQAVESDDAVNAPVQLGLTLLRDTDGVIEVDLPISGDLSDPDFSVGKVVMRAFVNLLVKAAASPFSMLGSIAEMAGLSGEELGMVSFSPGSVDLADGEAEKLAALADALKQRPDLLLNIRGGVSPEADGLALLKESLTRGGKDLSDAQWDVARKAYLAGERDLPPEALNNLATARGVAVRKLLQDTHEVPTEQLFLLDPSRNASVGDNGNVIVEFALGAR